MIDRPEAAETFEFVAESDGHLGLVVVVRVEAGERGAQPLRVLLRAGVSVLLLGV